MDYFLPHFPMRRLSTQPASTAPTTDAATSTTRRRLNGLTGNGAAVLNPYGAADANLTASPNGTPTTLRLLHGAGAAKTRWRGRHIRLAGPNGKPKTEIWGETAGQVDLFNGTTLCWTSYEVGGMAQGFAAAARVTPYFFNESMPYCHGEDGTAYFAGGVYNPGGSLSSSVYELRWTRGLVSGDGKSGGKEQACPLGTQLKPVRRLCGTAGANGGIDGFVERGRPLAPAEQPPASGSGGADAGGAGVGGAVAGGGVAAGGADGTGTLGETGPPGDAGVSEQGGGGGGLDPGRIVAFTLIALVALFASYMVSATLMIRHVEGMWRLPVGGGTCDILCRGVSNFNAWLCSCCGGPVVRAVKGDRRGYQSIGGGNGRSPPRGGGGGCGKDGDGGDSDGGGGSKDIEAVRKGNRQLIITSAVAVQPYSTNGNGGDVDGRQYTGVHLQHAPHNSGGGGGNGGNGGPDGNGNSYGNDAGMRAPDGRDGRPPVPPRRGQTRPLAVRGGGVIGLPSAAMRQVAGPPPGGGGGSGTAAVGNGFRPPPSSSTLSEVTDV
ncbi:unnamed protein product [Phaeothamnion confervicola]